MNAESVKDDVSETKSSKKSMRKKPDVNISKASSYKKARESSRVDSPKMMKV